jgi:hypothetical protein
VTPRNRRRAPPEHEHPREKPPAARGDEQHVEQAAPCPGTSCPYVESALRPRGR